MSCSIIVSPTTRSGVCALALLSLAAGCGGSDLEFAEVRGKVLLNGQPLTKGSVVTSPASGRGSFGIIQSDGAFELISGREPGALIGTHKVSVVATEGGGGEGAEAEQGRSILPARYNSPQTSGLSLEVTGDGDNSPVIELTSP